MLTTNPRDRRVLEAAQERVVGKMIGTVRLSLAPAFCVGGFSQPAYDELKVVFKKAMELFRIIHDQRGRYTIVLEPNRGALGGRGPNIDPDTMTDVDGGEYDGSRGHTVQLFVFPLVRRLGEEQEDNVCFR